MSNTVDSQIVEGLADFGRYRVQTLVQATANSTLTLTLSSVGYIIFTGTTAGQIVRLGNATTYQVGHNYLIHNNSTQSIVVQNGSSINIVTIAPNYRATLILQDNSSISGIWLYGANTPAQSFWIFENGLLTWTDETGADLLIAQYGGLGSAYVRQMSANGTKDAPLPITNGQRLGGYGYYGYNSGGPNGMPSAEDLITASEDHTPTAWGGDREWNTIANGTTTSVERMRLTNQGNLLIGTSVDNLQDKLQIARGSSVNFPMMEMFDDFLWTTLGSGTNPHSVVSAVSGTSAAITVETTATSNDYVGQIIATTGTTTTGRATIDFFNSVNKIRLGSKRIIFEGRAKVPTLSAAGQVFTVYVGLMDGNASGIPANGVYFTYTNGTNSGAWVGNCTSGSTNSPTNSAVTVVASQWYELRAEIDAARTVVEFYIDGVLIGTNNASNIPAATAGMRPAFKIEKSSGTTARTLNADYMYFKMFR